MKTVDELIAGDSVAPKPCHPVSYTHLDVYKRQISSFNVLNVSIIATFPAETGDKKKGS